MEKNRWVEDLFGPQGGSGSRNVITETIVLNIEGGEPLSGKGARSFLYNL